MKVNEELLWEYVAGRANAAEVECIHAALQQNAALAAEIERTRELHRSIIDLLAKNIEKASGGLGHRIMNKVTALEAQKKRKQEKGENVFIFILFLPFLFMLAGYYTLYFKERIRGDVTIDPMILSLAAVFLLVIFISLFVARFFLYKLNARFGKEVF